MKQAAAAADLMRPDARYGRAARAARKQVDGDLKAYELDDKGGVRPANADGDHWGYELILDCSNCNEKIDDPPTVTAYLKEMVTALKMVAVGEPLVHQFTGEGTEGRGTSGVQIITTSSITFHSDDDGEALYLNIFSCKKFDPQVGIDLTNKYFEPKKTGCLWLHRDAGPWPEK